MTGDSNVKFLRVFGRHVRFFLTMESFGPYYAILLASQYDGINIYPQDCVLDVGANIGLFTVLAAKRAKKVLAVEPLDSNFKVLKMNVRENGLRNVILFKKALSDKNGIGFLNGEGNLAKLSVRGKPVELIQVDNLLAEAGIEKVDVLKMNIEGGELKALKHSRFLNNVRELAIETHGKEIKSEIIEILNKNGFVVKERKLSYGKLMRNILIFLPSVVKIEIKSYLSGTRLIAIRFLYFILKKQNSTDVGTIFGKKSVPNRYNPISLM